jgi:hypothetical protein
MQSKSLAIGLLTSLLGACAAVANDSTAVAGDGGGPSAEGSGPTPSCADRSETYPDDHTFPFLGSKDVSVNQCAPRCGSVPHFFEGFYSSDALPAGTCAPSSIACAMAAHEMCPCPTHRGPVTQYQCSCESGRWFCAIAFRGASTCSTPFDSGSSCAREDDGGP